MITKEQLKILSMFKADLSKNITFKQIKERSRQKSNNIIQIALNEFKKQNLLDIIKVGNISTYKLNLKNNLSLSYLNLINDLEIQTKKVQKTVLDRIQNKIFRHTPFFILILFGSHVKNKAKSNSDIDVAVIVESEREKKEIIPYLETIKRRELSKIDYHIFVKDEFLGMLKADYENLGKQIYKNSIVYYGFINYINLIRGIKNEG